MFDVNMFVKIVLWFIATVTTLQTVLAVGMMHYFYHTTRGRLQIAIWALRGEKPVFMWRYPIIMVLAWIALICFN